MAGKEQFVGGIKFPTKKSLAEYAGQLLWAIPLGNRVPQENEDFLRDFFELHPKYEEKIGPGVDHFEVRASPVDGRSPGFYAIRIDGTVEDFSYRDCANGSTPTPAARFRAACRAAIQPHIVAEKKRYFAEAPCPTCAITGVPIDYSNSHVDHAPPYTFERIVAGFVALNKLDINNPDLYEKQGASLPTLSDWVMRDKFVQFHNNHANLRVISVCANLKVVPAAYANGGSVDYGR
mgnify:CR=1 FL=1